MDAPTNPLNISGSNEKRQDYLEWDDYFMATALLEMKRKSNIQNVALTLNRRKIITSIASNYEDRNFEHHAEIEAIRKAGETEKEVIYTVLFPCIECAQSIIKAGIKEVIYLRDNSENSKAGELFNDNQIKWRKLDSKKEIVFDFGQFSNELPLTP